MEARKTARWKMAAALILGIAILALAQGTSLALGDRIVKRGAPAWSSNILAGLLYASLTLAGLKLLIQNFLGKTGRDYRLSPFRIERKYVLLAVALPAFVAAGLAASGGTFTVNESAQRPALITAAIFLYGLAGGIVEESVFRGLIMGLLEERCGKRIAAAVPSFLFGLLHVIGRRLDFLSVCQLLIAGTAVGILFSVIAIESKSVWNAALVHGLWNVVFVGGILHIGAGGEASIYRYVLSSSDRLITGGAFGAEASLMAITAYLLCICVVYRWAKKRGSGL